MKAPVSSCCVIHVQYIGKQNRSKIGKKMFKEMMMYDLGFIAFYVIVYILNVVMDAFYYSAVGFP